MLTSASAGLRSTVVEGISGKIELSGSVPGDGGEVHSHVSERIVGRTCTVVYKKKVAEARTRSDTTAQSRPRREQRTGG